MTFEITSEKQEIMSVPEITQENVRILIPHKAAVIAAKIAGARRCPLKKALLMFYKSPTYKELEREETKRWRESPAQLYLDFASRRKS
jgi:hypothetical protein